MAAAAFGGYVPCGINTTRRGDGLAADIRRVDCQLRRYRATYMNYVGKPLALVLAKPEQPDDAENTLTAAFGNEATKRDIDHFARRFGCRVDPQAHADRRGRQRAGWCVVGARAAGARL